MDPLPEPEVRAREVRRLRRMIRYMAALALLVAMLAVGFVAWSEPAASIHLLIATAVLAGGTVLVGTVLMSLVFFSSRGGHDADAAHQSQERDSE